MIETTRVTGTIDGGDNNGAAGDEKNSCSNSG